MDSVRHNGRLLSLLTLSAITALVGIGPANATDRARPNILFMFTDDQPQSCLGCLGNRHIQTPNLDQLAANGNMFSNAFVTTAICCSNRACILTGQYMLRHGVRDFQTPLSAAAMAQTYPVLLRQAGYRTGYLGKFAVGAPRPESRQLALPSNQFDYWYGFPQAINFQQKVDGENRYLTDLMTEKAIEFLRSADTDQPFCLTVAFKEPHGPWNYFDPDVPNVYEDTDISPPATFTQQAYEAQPSFIRESLNGGSGKTWLNNHEDYQRYLRNFYRLITRVDLAVGDILDELRRLGLDKNTVVIYSSDHGSLLGAHGLTGKWLMYEESIRVPLIVFDPRLPLESRSRQIDQMALSIDLAPTMLALAGVDIPDSMQGRSLTHLLHNENSPWRDDFYYEHVYNTPPSRRPIVKTEGVRTERWKYILYPDVEPAYEQLFDLRQDPGEESNLATLAAHAGMLSRLRARCAAYRQSLK